MDVMTATENIAVGFVIGFLIGILVKIASRPYVISLSSNHHYQMLEARNILIVDWHRLTNGLIGQQEMVLNQTNDMFESLIEMGIWRHCSVVLCLQDALQKITNHGGRNRIRTRVVGLEGRSDIQPHYTPGD